MALLAALAAELEAFVTELLAALVTELSLLEAALESEAAAPVLLALLADERADESEDEIELRDAFTAELIEDRLPEYADDAEVLAAAAEAESTEVIPVAAGTALLVWVEAGGY